MKDLFLTFILLFTYGIGNAQEGIVFESGKDGYACYRIPATISYMDGHILAFAEGRVKDCGDFGDVDIVSKTSIDGGKTWSSFQKVVDFNNIQAGNPAPVMDYKDPAFPNGRLFLFYNTGNNSEAEVVRGHGVREVWFKTSTDFGETWSSPTNITFQVHKPNEPSFNPEYDFIEDWRHYANTPGHAIQLQNGTLYVPINFSKGDLEDDKIPYFAGAFYSQDHGTSFELSAHLMLSGSNESTAAQLSNGEVLLNARDQTENTGKRYYARSKDSGKTWYEQGIDQQLTDPVCEGSLNILAKNKVIISHLDSDKGRRNLVLQVSKDGGRNWTQKLSICKGSSAYSDLVVLGKKKVGVLYERDDYGKIVFQVLIVN